MRRQAAIWAVRPFTRPTRESVDYLAEDWDNLLILDACRYDTLARRWAVDQPIRRVHSNASHTREFLAKNFGDGSYPDIVYVTATPQLTVCPAAFAHVEHVWQHGWDPVSNTVLPETMVESALQVHEQFPEKRLIVHFMQPHYPFIGETGSQITDQASYELTQHQTTVWEKLQLGLVDRETVIRAYEENLDIALPAVSNLVESLDGKTVVTSDHGNLFGKRVCWLPVKLYGHPLGVHDPELTAVPWVEFPAVERRTITAGATKRQQAEPTVVADRLCDLGYV
ncbi:hypothetical protein [Haladaptatus sp. DYSN1]|uniref:hypothetical protein n=2 Tax=Haladaptatus TaxID=367188 RepID=UPI002406C085|nr:hypothetical protein [Haladaptatus sp. DYSN1]